MMVFTYVRYVLQENVIESRVMFTPDIFFFFPYLCLILMSMYV
jgi:hypothetical protein